MFQDYVTSLVRTWVPIAVGLLLTWLAAYAHVVISPHTEALLSATAVAVISSLYYALARLAEHYVPQLGVLLGVPKKPAYSLATVAEKALGGVTFDPSDQPSDLPSSPPTA